MAITQGTTCTLPLKYMKVIPEHAKIEVTFNQPNKQLTKRNEEDGGVYYEPIMDKTGQTQIGTKIYVDLSQEDTLYFNPGPTEVQIRYIDEEGETKASGIAIEKWEKILKKGVIKYE